MNKENKTKIPLPIDPLPQIPKLLVTRQRRPLKTLNTITGGSWAGTSTLDLLKNIRPEIAHPQPKKRITTLLNSRFYEDKEAELSQISISDEENDKSDVQKTSQKCLSSPRKRVKNSLRRPHSKELLGISDEDSGESSESSKKSARRRLEYEFSAYSVKVLRNDSNLYLNLGSEYFCEIFKYLLEREKPSPGVPNITKETRACLINWLLKINGYKGDPSSIQIAIWYFDSTVAAKVVPLFKLQLFAAACYWIALKITGSRSLSANKLVKYSNSAFSTTSLEITEKMVLKTLRFPVQPIIPQDYISYFAQYCDQENPELIESAATFICLAGMTIDKSLCEICPSVIGAAAIRTALLILDEVLLLRLQISPLFKMVVKKVDDISMICVMLRKAIRALSHPTYKYKTLIEFYGEPPAFVSHKICWAVEEMALRYRC